MGPKVLFITRAWPIGGGTEIWLDSLYGELIRRGNQIRVAIAEGATHNLSREYFRSSEYIKEGELLDGTSGSPAARSAAVRKALRKLAPDIVVPLRVRDGLEMAVSIKRRIGPRVVYPAHEYREGWYQDIKRFRDWIDRVVVCDELSKRVVVEISGIPDERVVVVPQGIDDRTISFVKPSEGPVRIGYAGRLEYPQKRVTDLVRICRGLEEAGLDYRLTVAGIGPEEDTLKSHLEHEIREGKVFFLGWVKPDELRKSFYSGVDVLVVTSEWETGPIVAWEAMAAGLVLVTSRYRGLTAAGFLEDGRNCLVFDRGDISGAVASLRRLAGDEGLRMRLARQARQDIVETRTLAAVAAHWEELFAEVMESPARVGDSKPQIDSVGSGRLERMGLPIALVESLRWLAGRRFNHQHPGEEWPFHSVPEPGMKARMEAALERFDVRAPVGGTSTEEKPSA